MMDTERNWDTAHNVSKAPAVGSAATAYEPKPYHVDPDENVQCPTCEKMNDDDARYCDQCGFKMVGAMGVKVGAPQAAPAS